MPVGSRWTDGFRFGLGFVLAVIVVVPLLAVGGCALILGAGSNADENAGGAAKDRRAPPAPAALLDELADRAAEQVAQRGADVRSSTCRDLGYRRTDFSPDFHLIRCTVSATRGASELRYHQRVECFAERPTAGACHADPPRRL